MTELTVHLTMKMVMMMMMVVHACMVVGIKAGCAQLVGEMKIQNFRATDFALKKQ